MQGTMEKTLAPGTFTIRPASERGHANHGWLDTYHSFSFLGYYDPRYMGFRSLRVINEDWIDANKGFGTHPHQDMEIITYVLSGALDHRDSLGTEGRLKPGIVQRMSAGTGILHSEFNASQREKLHLLQIWIEPNKRGIAPRYHDRDFPLEGRRNALQLLASADERDGSLSIQQDASVYASVLEPGHALQYELPAGRYAWLQVARGALTMNDTPLSHGDGVAIAGPLTLELSSSGDKAAEILLFDLP